MNFVIKTPIIQHYLEIAARFDEQLFLALAPPFPRLRVERFDGCHAGSEVWIELNALGFKQKWNAYIVEQQQTDTEWYFIDEGTLLPKPLTAWRHLHRVVKTDETHSEVIDDITYTTGQKWLDFLCFPFLYLLFWYRKPIYKKKFQNNF